MKRKRIISAMLTMILSFIVALPVYAEQPDYEFDEDTGILIIGKDIEKKPITHIVPPSIPQDKIIIVFIKDGVKELSDMAFMNCKNLQKVKIPNSMQSIGAGAFKDCISLQKINIPDNVTCSNDAFEGCEQLYIPNLQPTLPSVPTCPSDESFINSMNGWQLENVAAPYVESPMNECKTFVPIFPNQTQIPIYTDVNQNMMFKDSNYLSEVSIPDAQFDETTGHLTIGKDIENKKITDIVDIPQNKIKSVTIKDDVIKIDDYAFKGCTSLTSVTIGNDVTEIGEGAFYGCTSLTSITIPNSVTYINKYAFSSCTGLKSITIPDSVTKIDNYAFSGCCRLQEAIINNDATEIGYGAFADKVNIKKYPDEYPDKTTFKDGHLVIGKDIENKRIGDIVSISKEEIKSVIIRDDVIKIDRCLFTGCKELKEVIIGNDVTSIGENAFRDCKGLTSVTIGNGVKVIDNFAFHGCTGLTSINIPDSVTSIGLDIFSCCTGLTSVDVDEENQYYKSIDGVLFSKDGTKLYKYPEGKKATNYTIPDSVRKICKWAFEGCTDLTSVIIPDNVTSIGDYAFKGCTRLKEVTISNGVTSIGKGAFNNCTRLREVTIPRELDITGVFNKYVQINRK